jgi:hypothetical protein
VIDWRRCGTQEAVRPLLFLLFVCAACGRTEPVRYADDPFVFDVDAGLDAGFRFDAGVETRVVECRDGRFRLKHAQPVVGLVLDRSSSMNQTFGAGTTTRWSAVRTAITRVIPSVDQSMELGVMLFPSAAESCTPPAGFDIAPALGATAQIVSLVNRSNPTGSTPTALALERAAAGLLSRRTVGAARALVLATDGAPDCNAALTFPCTCVSGTSCAATRCLDDVRTLERVTAARLVNIPTFVIGIQNAADTTLTGVLDRMAVAGGRPLTGTKKYYSATSSAELETAFTTIRDQVGGCVFLTDSVPTIGDGGLALSIGGQPVPMDESGVDGWRWVDQSNGELVLAGAACQRAIAMPDDVLAVVACGPADAGVPDGGLQ